MRLADDFGVEMQPLRRQALDSMWTIQRQDGVWNWPKRNWPPFEKDDYYGAVLAAVGVSLVPFRS
jgi:squalene-hopene/tetraprenyl-beta-curcumene cyclase